MKLTQCEAIIVISGIRSCRKAVLLQQVRRQQKEQDYFINFDDDRLGAFRKTTF